MRFNNLVKSLPFLSTLLLIIILGIANKKENIKLRILIWNTPSLTLGSHLAVSTGTGFVLSYIITNSLSKLYYYQPKQQLEYTNKEQYSEGDNDNEISDNPKYDNTLIERDLKDPLPTITASFRVISRNDSPDMNFASRKYQYNDSFVSEEKNPDRPVKEVMMNNENSRTTDWNDQSFSDW